MTSPNSILPCPEIKVYLPGKYAASKLSQDLLNINYCTIILVNKGQLCLVINGVTIELLARQLIMIPVKSSCEIVKKSHQFMASVALFTSSFLFKNSITKPPIGYFDFLFISHPIIITIKRKEVHLLTNLFTWMNHTKRNLNRHFQKEVLSLSFNLLLYKIAGIYGDCSKHIRVKYTKKEKSVMSFFTILETHCREQRRVAFYADALYITAGYLNKIVKETTGKTAKQCITDAIIWEAKTLLQDDSFTISEIVKKLRFGNPSFFSNFFKTHTSMSPSAYRSTLNFSSRI